MSSSTEPTATGAPESVTAIDVDGVPLATKIALAMAEAGQVVKASTNTEQGYKFASAEAILGAVRLPLLRRGVLLLPHVEDLAEETITSRGGTKGTRVVLRMTFTFTDGNAELVFAWRGEGQDYGDKAYGKAFTNAVKTFIRSAWLLPTEHDDPENSPSGERMSNAPAELPGWARPANDARKRELITALEPILGRDGAKAIGKTIADNLGSLPDVVVATVKLVAGAVRAELDPLAFEAAAQAREARAAAAAQDAAAEAPDQPAPAPADGPAPDEEERLTPEQEAELERLEGRLEQATTDEPAKAPASVAKPIPEVELAPEALELLYRQAGCICPKPTAPDGETGAHDDACPIVGHGIPF